MMIDDRHLGDNDDSSRQSLLPNQMLTAHRDI